ncbi:cytochrome P450 [Amycolatopsis carbonis]|uniref:Cytochrome P450 n=1 Tax=Amycolatopsis carbonis TaxID=715471 RepID=A0A9Y2MQH7_9PSEU|nr:cytochrome P450 [Amycolatopsis sp. 2-15]WIX77275.1 cytochrome P450 [Amycolatopsis sp. 2-15]
MTSTSGCPVAHDFDPLAESYLSSPYPELNLLREQAPVHYVPSLDHWLVTRYADIAAILADPATFSAANAQAPLSGLTEEASGILHNGLRNTPVLSNFDPPGHSRVRRLLAPLFSPRRMAQLAPRIEQFTTELVDAFAGRGRVDIVEALTFPLPALTLFRLLGFPDEDSEQLKAWCGEKLEINWGRPDAEYQLRATTNIVRFWDYCEHYVETRKHDLGDDLTSDLLRQRETDPGALDDREVASIVFALSFAGHETTTNLIGNALRHLLSRPQLWAEIGRDPETIAGAVQETLRYDSSVIAWRRVTTREVTIGDTVVPDGARLVLGLGAANHDPAVFAEPEEFEIHRANAKVQLSFGRGIHYCLGQLLARVETEIVLRHLSQRFPDLRLAAGQDVRYPRNISFRGPVSMLVEWSAPVPAH